tara:strand:- start:359 stop:568 length:210 start_codon:yes stop_codon:yes gene_type:complete
MTNFENRKNELQYQIINLEKIHRELDNFIESCYNNSYIDDNIRKMKITKLRLKDEICRINEKLLQLELE